MKIIRKPFVAIVEYDDNLMILDICDSYAEAHKKVVEAHMNIMNGFCTSSDAIKQNVFNMSHYTSTSGDKYADDETFYQVELNTPSGTKIFRHQIKRIDMNIEISKEEIETAFEEHKQTVYEEDCDFYLDENKIWDKFESEVVENNFDEFKQIYIHNREKRKMDYEYAMSDAYENTYGKIKSKSAIEQYADKQKANKLSSKEQEK